MHEGNKYPSPPLVLAVDLHILASVRVESFHESPVGPATLDEHVFVFQLPLFCLVQSFYFLELLQQVSCLLLKETKKTTKIWDLSI